MPLRVLEVWNGFRFSGFGLEGFSLRLEGPCRDSGLF